MTSREDQIDRGLASITTTRTKVATYVGRDGTHALIDVGGTRVTVPFRGLQLPPPGHPVELQTLNGKTTVTGPARPLPTSGTITGLSTTGDVTLAAWGGQGDRTPYLLPVAPSYAPQIGDDVEIQWSSHGGLVVGLLSMAEPTIPPPRVVSQDPQTFHPDPFTATWSGSYSSAAFTEDVHATDAAAGGWGYGTKIADTIPDSALITAASIFLPARRIDGRAPRIRTHPHASRPAGALVLIGTAAVLTGDREGWVPIPTTLIDYLKANPGGLGLELGGNTVYRGVQADQYSGALDITWTA